MSFTQLLEQWRGDAELLHIPAGWSQGRATFGGLVAAMLYEKMASRLESRVSLRSLTFSFVAPAATGELRASADVLRAGRSVTQVEGRLIQGDSVVLAALASFGAPRESGVRVPAGKAPPMRAPEESEDFPYIPNIVPEFTQKFDYRIAEGALPFSGSCGNSLGGWVRLREAEEAPVDIGHLLALIDAWPPAVLPMLRQPAPASSLTWTVEFIEPLPERSGSDWWQYLAEVEQATDGYGVVQARLWDADGSLVAFTRQTVTVFD